MRLAALAVLAPVLALASPARGDVTPITPVTAPASAGAPTGSGTKGAPDRGEPGPDERVWGLSLYGRAMFVPDFLLHAFVQVGPPYNAGAIGAQFVGRKGHLDIVLSLDLAFLQPPDGNFLAAGKDPALDTHYTTFHDVYFLSADVAFVYRAPVTSWFAFLLGGGLGLGALLGEIDIINASKSCTADNAADTSKCYPISPWTDPKTGKVIGEIKPGSATFVDQLAATQRAQDTCVKNNGADCRDTAGHPVYHAADKPPALPVVNLFVGVEFHLHRHFSLQLTGGFRDGFFVGLTPLVLF